MITYNQEEYIAQAIDSVLMQQTTFDYELVIGDDCSSDATQKIALQYQKKFPGKIKVLKFHNNVGMVRNFARTLASCSGKYVAILDGDDYWTSPLKLQKQFDFLEQNKDFVICFHSANLYDETQKKVTSKLSPSIIKEEYGLRDIVKENFIPLLTVMFKNKLFDSFPDWYFTLKYQDWPLHILNAQFGKIGYLNSNMATYRQHPKGAASGAKYNLDQHIHNLSAVIRLYVVINGYFKFKYFRVIAPGIAEYIASLTIAYIRKIGYINKMLDIRKLRDV